MAEIKLAAFSDEAASPLIEQIQALKRNGISLMELRSIEAKNVLDFTDKERRAYKEILDGEGIGVWSIGSPLGKVDIGVDFNGYLDKVKYVCETANVFESKRIRAFSFFNAYNERNKVIDYLSKMVETAALYGVTICHENEKEIYGDNLERVKDIAASVKGLKLVYDPANFIQVGERAEDTLEQLHDKTYYFHIKDVVKKTGELVPAGFGDGNIDGLIKMINKDVTLTLEPHLAVFDAFKSIDNTEMKHKFKFASNGEAFDRAVDALKDIIVKNGYTSVNGGFVKGE